MKVILIEDVEGHGKKGEIVNAAHGYARNYLFPHKLAVPADEKNMRNWERNKEKESAKAAAELSKAQIAAKKIADQAVVIKAKTGEGERLFGSITNKDVAEAIEAAFEIKIDKRNVEMADHIKLLGQYEVKVKLHQEVKINVRILVERMD